MANKNKNKGKAGEREVAAIFSDVYKLSFTRVPNSGAFIGKSNAFRIDSLSNNQIQLLRGDIIPPDELPNLIIECKVRKAFSFHQLFSNSKELDGWVDQVTVDFKKGGNKGIWLIIFKSANKGLYCCYHSRFKLNMKNYLKYKRLYICEFNKEWLELNKHLIKNYSR